MKIVLIEERNGQPLQPERAYEHAAVKIGRDPAECHIVFNQSEWPMVSRKHAEFRFKNGRCLIVDTNSSFGTFLDGRRIMEATEVNVGARVQFGAGGPVMLVARLEQAQTQQPAPNLAEMETRRDLAPPDEITSPREAARTPPAGQPPQPPQPQQPAAPYVQPPQRPVAPPQQQQPYAQPPYGQQPPQPYVQPPVQPYGQQPPFQQPRYP